MPMVKEKGKPAYWQDEPTEQRTEKPRKGKKKKESDE